VSSNFTRVTLFLIHRRCDSVALCSRTILVTNNMNHQYKIPASLTHDYKGECTIVRAKNVETRYAIYLKKLLRPNQSTWKFTTMLWSVNLPDAASNMADVH